MNTVVKTAHPYWQTFLAVLGSITKYIKLKLAGGILIMLYGFFFNIDSKNLMIGLFFLIVFDFITGVAAAKISKEKIESRKVCRSAIKLGVYGLLVSSMHLTDATMHLTDVVLNLEMGMIAFLAATEAVSLIENAGKMGYAVPQRLLNSLSDFTQKTTVIHQEMIDPDAPNVVKKVDVTKVETKTPPGQPDLETTHVEVTKSDNPDAVKTIDTVKHTTIE